MAGINPYIETPEVKVAEKEYTITFLPMNLRIKVEPNQRYASTGLEGSILDIGLEHGIEMDHSCGGVCACSTCHVIIREGIQSCNEATEDEEDMLDLAPGLQMNSRLACQCVPDGSQDLVVEVPEWNRNLVREGGH